MQSKPAKIAVAVGSIALIVILFVVLSGGEEETASTTEAPAATTTSGGHGEEDGHGHEGGGDPGTEHEGQGSGGRKPEVPAIVVSGGEPEGGVARLEFKRGEQIAFSVESDVAEEIHVHGYDVYGDLTPGKPAEFGFAAEIEGVFEVELHGTGVVIAELTVEP